MEDVLSLVSMVDRKKILVHSESLVENAAEIDSTSSQGKLSIQLD